MPPRKRARNDGDGAAVLPVSDGLEARRTADRGNVVFATRKFAAGESVLVDHAVCLPSGVLPAPSGDGLDDLMRELHARHKAMVDGPWRLSHVQRHLDEQTTTDDELPPWFRGGAAEYNRLAAALQSNIARHADGDGGGARGGLVVHPLIHLANHSCAPSCDLVYTPDVRRGGDDALGCHTLRAARTIRRGEEVTYSYLGVGPPPPTSERRELLLRRWGLECECELCSAELPDG